jgi:uncharacterized repeat protein (TIGR01451 family)
MWRLFLALACFSCSIFGQTIPVITTQPQSKSANSGDNVGLTVAASGDAPLRYQWRLNTTNYVGATNATLSLSNITFLNGGAYRVVVANNSGSVTSEVAVLKVDQQLTFRITALLTNNARWVDHDAVTGDDRGGVAVSSDYVFVTGDNRTGRYGIVALDNGVGLSRIDAICNNLRDERLYTLANGVTPLSYGGSLNFTTINSLIELDPATGNTTANRITLSAGVPINTSSMLFSGWDRVVLYSGNNSHVYSISLPSGRVVDIGVMSSPARNFSENWASWGLAEYFDNAVHLVYVQDFQTIVRRRAPATATTVVTSFDNIGETASIGFSPSQSRWYFHHEYNSQFTGTDVANEVLGSAKGSFTVEPNYPFILTNPISRSVYIGSNAVLNVAGSGGEPLAYQWLFNGQPIAGAISSTLLLTNVQLANAGSYSVRVSNPFGAVSSAGAVLTVITTPFIVVEPQSRSVFRGSNTTFSVLGDGAPPLNYQWQFNGVDLPGATNASLLLTNVQPAQAGFYSVRVFNRFGAVDSVSAELFVASVMDDASTFQVASMATNGARFVDAFNVTSYGVGSLAVSSSNIFYTGFDFGGSYYSGRFPIDTLAGGTRIGRTYQALVSNLRTEKVYSLGDGPTPLGEGGTVTTLLEVDGVTGQLTGNQINLSAPINATDLSGQFDRVGIFAGYDRIVIHNNSHVYNIALPSGKVTDLGYLPPRQHNYSYGWAYWGVAENVGGLVYLVYMRDSRTVVRTRVPDGLTTTLVQFPTTISFYLSAFTVSIQKNRWYFEFPFGSSVFGNFSQSVGYANAAFTVDSGPNIDHFEWDPIPTLQAVNVPMPVRLTARTSSGTVASNFNGVVTLSARDATTGTILSSLPTSISGFISGVWTGQVTVLQPASAAFLRADDRNGNVGNSGVFSVSPQNDIGVQITDAPDPVVLGQNLTYTITVTNTGPSLATAVVLSNTLPTNVTFVAAFPSQGSCSNSSNFVGCDLGAIPNGVPVQVLVTVTPMAIGSITAQARVTRGEADPDPSNNIASATTLVTNPSLSIRDLVVTEGDSGTNTFELDVRLSVPSTNIVTVNYSTQNGTATAPADYLVTSGTLTFPPGSTNQKVSISVRGDISYETNETFFVNLSSPQNSALGDNQAVVTILNDDPPPLVSISDVTVTEGNSGTTNAVFRVSLSAPNGLAVVVRYSTSNGTARAGTDYVPRNGAITFSPGTIFLTQTLTIQVIGDAIAESNELFYVNLTSVSNGILSKAQGVGTILNDEGLGVFSGFGWSEISSPQSTNIPIPITLTAQDFFGTPVTNFNGTVTLRGAIGQPQIQGTLFPTNITHDFSDPNGPYTFAVAFTPSVDMTVTHARHYSGSKVTVWTDDGVPLATEPVVSTPGSWTETPFTTPVPLRAGTTYRVSFFQGSDSYYYTTNLPNSFDHGAIGETYYAFGDAFPQNPLGQALFLVDLRYAIGAPAIPIAMSPSTIGPFINGVWSGLVSALQQGTNVHLEVDDGQNHTGASNPFDILGGTGAQLTYLTIVGDEIRIGFRGQTGNTYRVERSEDLVNWTLFSEFRLDTNDAELLDDFSPSTRTRFYRASIVVPP